MKVRQFGNIRMTPTGLEFTNFEFFREPRDTSDDDVNQLAAVGEFFLEAAAHLLARKAVHLQGKPKDFEVTKEDLEKVAPIVTKALERIRGQ